jgi:tRNA pseudouridine32 synthase/23S rRNA pseudouridine746 synthase
MHIKDPFFTHFRACIEKYDLPEHFTFPFYYQPHPLCILAAQQLQQHLETQTQWQHNFGLFDDPNNIIGKMFGVLLVKNVQGELGFISAFSGKLAKQSQIQGFVPPVFDLLAKDSFFLSEQVTINTLNQKIDLLESAPQLAVLRQALITLETKHSQQLSILRDELVENRKARKIKRQTAASQIKG